MTNESNEQKGSQELMSQGRKYAMLELIWKNSSKEGRGTKFDEFKSLFPKSSVLASSISSYLTTFVEMGAVEKLTHGTYGWRGSLEDKTFANTEYGHRRQNHSTEKESVARACLQHKRANGQRLLASKFCLICQGSSTEPLFKEIREASPDMCPQSVVTNSIPGCLILLGCARVGLTIIGGKADISRGAIRPVAGPTLPTTLDEAREGEARSGGAYFGAVGFNLVVLSCSSINPKGEIWCGDEMEDFRRAILKDKEIDVVVLADRTKLTKTPVGVQVGARIEPSKGRTWLFVDSPEDAQNMTKEDKQIFEAFEKIWGEGFVPVPV